MICQKTLGLHPPYRILEQIEVPSIACPCLDAFHRPKLRRKSTSERHLHRALHYFCLSYSACFLKLLLRGPCHATPNSGSAGTVTISSGNERPHAGPDSGLAVF